MLIRVRLIAVLYHGSHAPDHELKAQLVGSELGTYNFKAFGV